MLRLHSWVSLHSTQTARLTSIPFCTARAALSPSLRPLPLVAQREGRLPAPGERFTQVSRMCGIKATCRQLCGGHTATPLSRVSADLWLPRLLVRGASRALLGANRNGAAWLLRDRWPRLYAASRTNQSRPCPAYAGSVPGRRSRQSPGLLRFSRRLGWLGRRPGAAGCPGTDRHLRLYG